MYDNYSLVKRDNSPFQYGCVDLNTTRLGIDTKVVLTHPALVERMAVLLSVVEDYEHVLEWWTKGYE